MCSLRCSMKIFGYLFIMNAIVEIYRIQGWPNPSGHPVLFRWYKWTDQCQIVPLKSVDCLNTSDTCLCHKNNV